MRYLILSTLLILFSCSPFLNRDRSADFSLVDHKLLFNKKDSLLFIKVSDRVRSFSDSCRVNKLNCFYDNETSPAAYPAGINMFRTHFLNHLDLKKFTKASDSRIKIIIGNKDNIRNVEISGLRSENAQYEILRVLKLPLLNRWHTANTVLGKSESELVFRLQVK